MTSRNTWNETPAGHPCVFVVVWGHKNLSSTAQSAIADPLNDVFLSAASHWEIAIKVSSGKLTLSAAFRDLIEQSLARNNFKTLAIEIAHSEAIVNLSFHHRDPFDRMLVAQALVEKMPLVSADAQFDAYAITRLW